MSGVPGSPGVVIGPAQVIDLRRPGVVRRRIGLENVDDEVARFARAVSAAAESLREIADRARSSVAPAESSILQAYVLMVEDPSLHSNVESRIRRDRLCAEWALGSAVAEMADRLRASKDSYLSERSHDFEFVGDRIQMALSGRKRMMSIPDLAEPTVLVARDLSPAETAVLDRSRVLALVTEVGSRTSHTAILARALQLPAVVGVGKDLRQIGSGDLIVVDGTRGQVTLSPTAELVTKAKARLARQRDLADVLRQKRQGAATTRCGEAIDLRANIELPTEAAIALEQGARGIGLYRTEFLYVDRVEPPTEEEQYHTYRRVLQAVSPLPVTLRTFDIGGDKFVSAFRVPEEMNPALGLRAVRLGLRYPSLLKTQLCAMLRASAHGQLSIMVPMVSSVSELSEVRSLFEEARQEVQAAGYPLAPEVPLGAMIEVPAAAVLADRFAEQAEFLSVGTNDLIQYALAVDRTNGALTHLASPFDPAILRLIENVVAAGQKCKRPVTVCGAMASDPLAAILLVGMKIRSLSLEAAAIPRVHAALARVDLSRAEALAAKAREECEAKAVEDMLLRALGGELSELLDSAEA